MAKDDDALEPTVLVDKIPGVGGPIDDVVRSFRASILFFRKPEEWVDYIRGDTYGIRSLLVLFGGLFITYWLMKFTSLPTNSHSELTFRFVQVFLFASFAVLLGVFIKVLGSPARFITIVSGLIYVIAMALPLVWLAVVLIWLLGFAESSASADPWIGVAIIVVAIGAAVIGAGWLVSQSGGIEPIIKLVGLSAT